MSEVKRCVAENDNKFHSANQEEVPCNFHCTINRASCNNCIKVKLLRSNTHTNSFLKDNSLSLTNSSIFKTHQHMTRVVAPQMKLGGMSMLKKNPDLYHVSSLSFLWVCQFSAGNFSVFAEKTSNRRNNFYLFKGMSSWS